MMRFRGNSCTCRSIHATALQRSDTHFEGNTKRASVSVGGKTRATTHMLQSEKASHAESWQIITGEKEFRDVQGYLQKVGISHNGFNYNVVAVFGSQSTGKSTLLNKLFGTRFATMDTISRQQTTKGIWISRAKDTDILVMDVEGTDGRERGDDQDFERKSALFSIATSEVLVVNMWETQVGLYNGANMGLLKTVFEVNLQIFQNNQTKKERSLLLFVIRDHLGTTPIENLQASITSDLEKMWNALLKPAGTTDTSLSDYFDLKFVGLPHKVLMADAFDQEVAKLRSRFVDQSGDIIFKPEYHKRIPADGFSTYARGVWEAIEANKDLDLPSQQELLAQFRCDEIASAALSIFDDKIQATERAMHPGVVYDQLAADMTAALSDALKAFDVEASRYHNNVYSKKRSDLLSSIEARLLVLYKSQMAAKRKQCVQNFQSTTAEEIRSSKTYNFRELTSRRQDDVVESFRREAEACRIDPMDWSYEDDVQLLINDITEVTSQLRSDETKRTSDRLYKSLKKSFEESVSHEFNTMDNSLWDRILDQCIVDTLGNVTQDFAERLDILDVTDLEKTKHIALLQQRAWKLLRGRINEETSESHLLLKLREHFEDLFKFNTDGVPIVWKAGDDIDGSYRVAREKTLAVIPVFSRIQRFDGTVPDLPESEDEDFDQDSILRILSSPKQSDLTSRFKKIADAVYVDAKRSTVSSVASIPLYFYGLLLILGWNELLALLRNPLYFITIIFSGLVAYAVYTLNLAGPVEQVGRAMLGTAFDIGKQRLRSALEISQESVPELLHSAGKSNAAPRNKTSEEFEMGDLSSNGKKEA